jgi:hypothetical protein
MWVRATDGELVNLGHARRVRIDRHRADHCDVVAWFGVELGNTIKIAEGISETAARALICTPPKRWATARMAWGGQPRGRAPPSRPPAEPRHPGCAVYRRRIENRIRHRDGVRCVMGA